MHSDKSLVLFFALFFVCAWTSSQLPSPEYYKRCSDIGVSNGCSGCSNAESGCEWCALPSDQAFHKLGLSNCAPKGHCDGLPRRNGESFVPAGELCPANTSREPIVRGQNPFDKTIQTIHSQAFDSHYCDFSQEPWLVDRFANIYGNDDSARTCFGVNHRLNAGSRAAIEADCNVDMDNPKTQACYKLYQSFLCTSACPEYGKPDRFNVLCHDVCTRLEQTCMVPARESQDKRRSAEDEESSENGGHVDMLSCLMERARVPYDCAPQDSTDCSRPDLIPASGRFEYDNCFYHSSELLCPPVSNDCTVQLSATFSPAVLLLMQSEASLCWADYDDDYPNPAPPRLTKIRGNQPVLITPPYCAYSEASCPGGVELEFGAIVTQYEIVNPGGPGGESCEDALLRQMGVDYPDAFYLDDGFGVPPNIILSYALGSPDFDICAAGKTYTANTLDLYNCFTAQDVANCIDGIGA